MLNSGYYNCKNCKAMIMVKSISYHQGWKYPKIIKKCPHCNSETLIMITEDLFNDFKHKLWINVKKNKTIFGIKFK